MGLVHKISERPSGALVATGVTCAPGVIPVFQIAAATRLNIIFLFLASNYSVTQYLHHVNKYFGRVLFHKNSGVHSPMKPPNVTYLRQSDLKYKKNDLKLGKNDLKYCDLIWDFRLGGLNMVCEKNTFTLRTVPLLCGIVLLACPISIKIYYYVFCRYLYRELNQFYRGEHGVVHSIFEEQVGTTKLKIKEHVSIHLYISQAPSGDAYDYSPKLVFSYLMNFVPIKFSSLGCFCLVAFYISVCKFDKFYTSFCKFEQL